MIAVDALRAAYTANILILVPVAFSALAGLTWVHEGRLDESPGWRTLSGSLWTAILAVSVYGLGHPKGACLILVFQVVYKSLWLALFALPRALSGRSAEVPRGIALSFLAIVLIWPWIIPWRELLDAR